MQRHKSKKVFSLDLSSETGRVKLSANEKSSDDEKTIRHYEFKDISDNEIKKMCASVVDLLNRANQRGKINRESLKELQTTGLLLYDGLLTGRVKEQLTATNAEHLILSIDDHLVQIPWEIMFDGKSFLCQRFNMGRVVSTSQRTSEPAVRKVKKPVKMLVIADPRGDLEASYKEGVRIRDILDTCRETVEVHLRCSLVDSKFVKGALRDFDVLHYAGHADYDIQNPSNSGFLLQEGKLRSSDIINMIGPAPLPSMVFSNACKSGHTDMWRVGKDYETEIYGLANAFLLAGVQHYIGTFWDVQDEPSLYFAVDFYKELMNGAMVGEAMRKARLSLVKKYGEENVIWASYMLYGDPTVRYVDLSGQEKADEKRESTGKGEREREAEMAVRGSTRGMEEVVAFPQKKQKWTLIMSVILLVSALLIALVILRTRENPRSEIPVMVSAESKEAKAGRIDELVAALAGNYREGISEQAKDVQDEWTSGPLIMVLMDVKSVGGSAGKDSEKLAGLLPLVLQNEERISIVEREMLDKLLDELKLSTSDLADPSTSLRLGRILSAKIMLTGSIIPDAQGITVILRAIDTETSSVRKVISEESSDRDIDREMVHRLGKKIVRWAEAEFPLQGKIISISEDRYQVNLGQVHGLSKGDRLEVIRSYPNGTSMYSVYSELEIQEVGADMSWAVVPGRADEIRQGDKVREKRG